MKEWLVEIRLKDWKPDLKKGGRVVTYVEVLANDQIHARHEGFDSFVTRTKYEPLMRRIMQNESLELKDCCAPDAVEL